jgi:hypothetical protein
LSGATLTVSAVDQPTGSGWSMTERSDAHARFVDKHGRVLESPQLYLIYWGSAWQASPTPNAAQITDAVRTLLASAYLTGLIQYRGSGHGALRGSTLVPSDPPDGFADNQVADFVEDQITRGTVPGPDPDNQTVYGVVLPTGVTPESPGWTGEHNYSKRSGQKIPYAWFSNAGDLASVTGIISHELVEAATNPDGHGFLGVREPAATDRAGARSPTCANRLGLGSTASPSRGTGPTSTTTASPRAASRRTRSSQSPSRRLGLGTWPSIRRPDMPRVKHLDPVAAA